MVTITERVGPRGEKMSGRLRVHIGEQLFFGNTAATSERSD